MSLFHQCPIQKGCIMCDSPAEGVGRADQYTSHASGSSFVTVGCRSRVGAPSVPGMRKTLADTSLLGTLAISMAASYPDLLGLAREVGRHTSNWFVPAKKVRKCCT